MYISDMKGVITEKLGFVTETVAMGFCTLG